ncbi:hypothetical protein Bca4012_030453 [Brassica carinata]
MVKRREKELTWRVSVGRSFSPRLLIESSLSSSSDGDRGDSPKSSLSPVSMRAAESTDDNVPIIHRHVPYRDRGGLLRRSVRTTPVKRHPISLPPPTGFSAGVERICGLGVQQWPQFDCDRIFRSVPRVSAAAWGIDSGDRSGRRGRDLLSLSRPTSSASSHGVARSPSVRTGGILRAIPAYTDVWKRQWRGQAIPLNCDMEPERAAGESSGINPTAPTVGESVRDVDGVPLPMALAGGFMADAIRSSVQEGRLRSESLKRLSEDVLEEDMPGEKRPQKDPSAFTDIPDADDLVHAQVFKDMARSYAQSKVHAVRLVYLYEKDLKRAMGKLEDMFAENELRDDRIKELEADLSASSSREAILLSQIGDHHNSVGARIDYLERSCEDYVAREVARAVREAIMKYRERLERVKAYLADRDCLLSRGLHRGGHSYSFGAVEAS